MGSATGVRAFAIHGRVARESPSRDAPVRQRRHRVLQASISGDARIERRPVTVILNIRVVVDRKSAPRLGVPHRSIVPASRTPLGSPRSTGDEAWPRRGRGVALCRFLRRAPSSVAGSAESSSTRAKVQKVWRQFYQMLGDRWVWEIPFSRARVAARGGLVSTKGTLQL